MSRRILAVLFIVLALTAAVVGSVQADDGAKRVGLVIGFPDGSSHLEIVTAPLAATTYDILKAADIDLASQEFAFGPAICGINGVGCPLSDCFCDPTHFWAYYHLTDSAWAAAAEGIGSYVPADMAVEGFAWSGFDAAFNPTEKPPLYTFDEILNITEPPVAVPEPATILLLTGGLAGLAALVRRAKR